MSAYKHRFGRLLRAAGIPVALTAVSLLGCEGSSVTTPGESPALVIPRGGDAQTAAVGTAVDIPPSVRVVSPDSAPVPGVRVVFRITRGDGRLIDSARVTDRNGIAQVGAWILGTTPGTNELRVVTPESPSLQPAAIFATAVVGAPVGLDLVGVPDTLGVAGGEVVPPPSVRVVDEFGNAVRGVTVRFEVVSGGGTVSPSLVETDAAGEASPDRWVLGSVVGPNVLRAILPGIDTVTFRVQAEVDGEIRLRHEAGDDQFAAAGSAVPVAPAVRVLDSNGNPRSGVTVHFRIEAGDGSVTPTTVTSDAQGIARVDRWVLGPVGGANVLLALAPGSDTVVFRANATDDDGIELQKVRGDGQSGAVGSPLPVPPTVRLVDGDGTPIADYPVDFTVETGGGALSSARVRTDGSGEASVQWTLGADTGDQLLSAQADGWDRVVFTAVATAASVQSLTAVAGLDQSAPESGALPTAPTVRARDAFGNPVSGVEVTFTVVEGGGTVERPTATTDADGLASAGTWTVGASGPQRLRASVPSGASVDFTATAVQPGSFDITMRFISSVTTAQRTALERAAQRWRDVIVGDLPPVQMSIPADQCIDGQPALSETVDDLLIFVRIKNIDGPGQVLGSAAPCYLRSGSGLPVVGIINLDSADLSVMANDGILDAVLIHEMGHVLGIGTLWSRMDLLAGAATADPLFTGEGAANAFEAVGGDRYAGAVVPVENQGGAGTRDAHWREEVMASELMTGWVGRSPNPLSVVTIASLTDMGYVVDLRAADGYVLPLSAAPPLETRDLIRLHEVPPERGPFLAPPSGGGG